MSERMSLRDTRAANAMPDNASLGAYREGAALLQARRESGGHMRFPDHASYLRYQRGRAQVQLRQQFRAAQAAPAPAPAPAPTSYNAMLFDGENSYVKYPNDSNLAIGTRDFTIEWYQYWENGGGGFPRPFSIGSYSSSISIAVSYEGPFYLWINGTPHEFGSQPPRNVWKHIAIVGNSGEQISVYIDGIIVLSRPISYNLSDDNTDLTIGNETTLDDPVAFFKGKITNFRWVVGRAVYTTNFTPPSVPLSNITDVGSGVSTQLLLLTADSGNVTTDSSSANRTPTSSSGVTFSSA